MHILFFNSIFVSGSEWCIYSVDPIVKDIIRTYDDDFSLVQRKYHQFSSGEAYTRMLMERPLILQSSPKQIYEIESDRSQTRFSDGTDDQVSYLNEPEILFFFWGGEGDQFSSLYSFVLRIQFS